MTPDAVIVGTGALTQAGEPGMVITGGQRQRIAITPMVLTDPEVLLLDEAMSPLDAEAEQAPRNPVAQIARSPAVIAIAHRLPTAANARIRPSCPTRAVCAPLPGHRSLMDSDGPYRRGVTTQLLPEPSLTTHAGNT